MHLQTLAITINQSLIGHDRYYEAGFRAGTPQQDRVCEAMNAPVGISSGRTVCVSRWRGFATTSSEKRLLRAINKQRQGITITVTPCLCYYKFSRLKVITEASERSRFLRTISPSSLRCGQRSWQGQHRKCYATQRTQHRGWLPADTVQSGQRPEKWPDRSSAYRPRWKLHGTW